MFCTFCGSDKVMVRETMIDDYGHDNLSNNIIGKFCYCGNCMNEFTVKYNPLKLVKVTL